MRSGVFISAFAAVILFAFPSTGQSINEVVAQRQQDMKTMAAAAKTIATMFKSPDTYSPTAFRDAAETITRYSGTRLVADFATVTAVKGSEANELIAAERKRFAQLSNDLERYAEGLADAASDSPGSMPDEMRMRVAEQVSGGPLAKRPRNESNRAAMSAEHTFHMMLETCTSCHARYRLRD